MEITKREEVTAELCDGWESLGDGAALKLLETS